MGQSEFIYFRHAVREMTSGSFDWDTVPLRAPLASPNYAADLERDESVWQLREHEVNALGATGGVPLVLPADGGTGEITWPKVTGQFSRVVFSGLTRARSSASSSSRARRSSRA